MTIADLIAAARLEPRPLTSRAIRAMASDHAIEAALVRGDLCRVLPGLYAAGEHGASWSVRAAAACAWMPPGGALTGRGALFAWGVIDDPGDGVGVVVPRGHHRQGPPWMRVVSQTHPITGVVARDGLTLAPAELALIHAYRWEPESTRASLVYSACAGRGLDPGAVRELMEVLPRVRGRRELERLLDRAADGIESFLEERGATTVLVGRELEHLIRQHRLTVAGDTFRIDAYDPRTRTAIELDGAAWHSTPAQRLGDIRRDALLASIGILTLRLGFVDVMQRPVWCRARVLDTLRRRRVG